MRVIVNKNRAGETISFSFSGAAFKGPWAVYTFLKKITGITFKHKPIYGISSFFGEEEFCIFEWHGVEFGVSDMFGSSESFTVYTISRSESPLLLELKTYFDQGEL
jgi:hypothetical protein